MQSEVELTRVIFATQFCKPETVPVNRNCGMVETKNLHRIELRALGKISPGEELTVSYVDFLNVSEDRRQQLKKQYCFDCTCQHCQKGIKDDLMLAVNEGGEKPSQERVKEIIQFSKDTLEKIDKARSEGIYHELKVTNLLSH
ncbi:UNVERIFIED_CONTAM: Histone-lysine N-methyltransferase smyd1 [Gekko kuhli]